MSATTSSAASQRGAGRASGTRAPAAGARRAPAAASTTRQRPRSAAGKSVRSSTTFASASGTSATPDDGEDPDQLHATLRSSMRASAHSACSRSNVVLALRVPRHGGALGWAADVAGGDERVPAQPARIVPRNVEPVVPLDQLDAVGFEPLHERDVGLALRPAARTPARRFSTPRFQGQTSWQMSQP